MQLCAVQVSSSTKVVVLVIVAVAVATFVILARRTRKDILRAQHLLCADVGTCVLVIDVAVIVILARRTWSTYHVLSGGGGKARQVIVEEAERTLRFGGEEKMKK